MKRQSLRLVFLLAVSLATAAAQTGTVVTEKVHSPALEGNKLGDSATREVLVYLPAGYQTETAKRYPVVYLLHGYTGNARMWQSEYVNLPRLADMMMAGGKVAEMIVVMPDGSNAYRGSFYVNSAATGNWEDFIVRDLVQFIDKKYRTIATRDARGIAGHSMGGYGALSIAMKHPDVFAAVYGLSPCCLVWGQDFSLSNPAWQRTLSYKAPGEIKDGPFFAQAFLALSGAWSPNPQKGPMFADFPVEMQNGKLYPVEAVRAIWSSNLLVPMAKRHFDGLGRLRAIAFDVGTREEFPHILVGSKALDEMLTQHGIEHRFELYDGDHGDRISERIANRMLPFFAETLERQARPAAATGQ
jgi:enterochelin esterase-like enzyme